MYYAIYVCTSYIYDYTFFGQHIFGEELRLPNRTYHDIGITGDICEVFGTTIARYDRGSCIYQQ
jgi:hypothetical protein